MTIKAYQRGHAVHFDEMDQAWRYADTNELCDGMRPCVRCGKSPTKEGYDACLGHIEGVRSACCGHGVEKSYIVVQTPIVQ